MKHADVIIVGAGHGGAQCAVALRQNGFAGSIAMIGREPEAPYERPPLSKEYLARAKPFERLYIRPPKFWEEQGVQLILGYEVVGVDPAMRRVLLSGCGAMTYRSLVWAAGDDPRKLTLPGAELAGVHAVRTKADCDQLMGEIDGGARKIVVIGGGYIGLEAAAVLTKLGCAVTLLEALPRVLARVAGEELSRFFEAEHRAHGVDLRTSMVVEALEGTGRVSGVRLNDGSVIEADALIVGIGIVPSVGPLVAAGATGAQGIEVDQYCRTTLADVYAIGDCVAFACGYANGATIRVESVQNATDQATCVAKAITGNPQPYQAFPWFWSNQYDLRLQTAGLSTGYDATVVRGDPDARAFSVVYLRAGQVVALDCVNMVKDYVQGRKLIEEKACPALDRLADASVPLKDLLTTSQSAELEDVASDN